MLGVSRNICGVPALVCTLMPSQEVPVQEPSAVELLSQHPIMPRVWQGGSSVPLDQGVAHHPFFSVAL